ncbi:trehalose 6-phosphate phosphatase [Zunongwangia mangrovi]|uniref:Trehalose 6-phosphate phosphatase n=1 Tax=Zunongwangia mangrovi TaxID=1334022 RepID=A0A1I1EEM6_9FLAO|nr:trehalose-phosphatase [Zunongwangia mangrovi]SFB85591.1 trehalose 6-phosphate phosphatase [Zunongwangia mangrovi]
MKTLQDPKQLDPAIENLEELQSKFSKNKPLIFLDFDGTLAPIVENHEDAGMDDETRKIVKKLSQKYAIAVVSGRGLSDVREKVGLTDIYYAGSHGFEIAGPNNFEKDNEEAEKMLPVFNEIEEKLQQKLKVIDGVRFERKKFTLAIHYRQVAEEKVSEFHKIIENEVENYPKLHKGDGKKVVEIKPNIDWHKGKAVNFLRKELSEEENPFSIYLGDDTTDEDAFREMENGIGILVGEHANDSYADYRVENIEEVKQFLNALL